MSALLDALRADIGAVFGVVYPSARLIKRVPTTTGDAWNKTKTGETATNYDCKALVEEFSGSQVVNSQITEDDRKIIILQSTLGAVPEAGDAIVVPYPGGPEYKIGDYSSAIPAVTADPANGAWICHGRK